MRTRVELALFAAAWAVYDLARWIAAGELGPATEHARWVLDLENSVGIGVERSVQQAFDADAAEAAMRAHLMQVTDALKHA